jgi:hypothetical protein
VAYSHYYVPGMTSPYWYAKRNAEGQIIYAGNKDSDTDMGGLYGEEFEEYFPYAIEITEEQYTARDISDADTMKKMHAAVIEQHKKALDLLAEQGDLTKRV